MANTKRKYPQELIDKAIEMYVQGIKVDAIVRMTGITHSTILRYAVMAGASQRRKSHARNPDDIDKETYITQAYRQGERMNIICKVTGISEEYILNYVTKDDTAVRNKTIENQVKRVAKYDTHRTWLDRILTHYWWDRRVNV